MGNFLGKLLEAILDFIWQMFWKKGEKKNRKKSLKQFWKDHKAEEKKKADDLWALPFKEKVKRSFSFMFWLIFCGITIGVIFGFLAVYAPVVFKWVLLVIDGSWISELREPGSQWR